MPSDTRLIFDFGEQRDENAGQHDVGQYDAEQYDAEQYDTWQSIDDVVMGGVSTSEFHIKHDGVAIFEGSVSLEQGGGFASVSSPPTALDLDGFSGLEVRVRGDGQRYRLRLRTDVGADTVAYQAVLTTQDGTWQTEKLPFDAFKARYHGQPVPEAPPLDASSITSFGLLIADGQAGPFRLEVDWIRAYAEEGC